MVDDCDERNDNERDESDIDMFVLVYVFLCLYAALDLLNSRPSPSASKICHA